MSCNKCGLTYCNCLPTVPTYQQFVPCPPITPSCCPPMPPPAVKGLNLLYTGLAIINLEFFNMPGVPKILIPAPGPGKLIVPLQMWNFLKFGTTPYADNAAQIPTINVNIGSTGIYSDSSILGSGSDITTYYQQPSLTVAGTLANQPLTLSTISQPIVGDSVLYSYIIYSIVNL